MTTRAHHTRSGLSLATGIVALVGLGHAALAQARSPAKPVQAAATDAVAPKAKDRSSALGGLGSNRDPIKIDSDRLDVYDKEGRAVFSGNVIAVQGDSTMRCTALTVLYEAGRGAAGAGAPATKPSHPAVAAVPAPAPVADGGNPLARGDSAIKRLDCKGPVTIATKTQVATGDNAEFDRAKNKVFLIGNAALSDGPNVTRGERVAYDVNTGVANVEGGRVRALIVPGSQNRTPGAAPAKAR